MCKTWCLIIFLLAFSQNLMSNTDYCTCNVILSFGGFWLHTNKMEILYDRLHRRHCRPPRLPAKVSLAHIVAEYFANHVALLIFNLEATRE
jgi:hypothetical protein